MSKIKEGMRFASVKIHHRQCKDGWWELYEIRDDKEIVLLRIERLPRNKDEAKEIGEYLIRNFKPN